MGQNQKTTITLLVVVKIPEVVAARSDDQLIDDVVSALSDWPTHEDDVRAEPVFASVHRGISDAAVALGCEEEE
jgi:hypothetical protein